MIRSSKHLTGLLALLCALMLILPAFAESRESFEKRCDLRVTEDVTLYEQNDGNMIRAGTLAKDTLCVHLGYLMDWECIQYMENDILMTGWIRQGYTKVIATNRPSSTPTPRPLTMAEVLAQYGLTTEDDITVLALGTAESRILANGREMLIPTWVLVHDSPVKEGFRVCSAAAPRTGKISLFESENAKSKTLCSIPGGQIMEVLETGDEFTKVSYKDQTGYVRNTSVTFWGKRAAAGHGTVHVKGNTDGSKTVKVRLKASSDAVSSFSWHTGTQITILSKSGDWYEAEAEGFTGYISASYVTDITED
ncbi:MAG: hypothetical protein CW338_05775 [Clostridiales bacterium]|nr:hypothetical protein [Clostridiales bacterium]